VNYLYLVDIIYDDHFTTSQIGLKKTGRERGQKWTIQTHRQHWAQDTERRKTVRTIQHNTTN
jgi:hypothetical protein